MPESRNRDLATSLGQAVKNNTITSTGSLTVVGLTAYDSSGLLPSSYDSSNSGTLGFAKDSDRLYIHTGQGWFNIAIVNTTPIFTTSPDNSYALAADATAYNNGTATTITLAARDSEGFPLTWSYVANTAFNNMAYISNDSSVYTIIPKSQDSAGQSIMPNGSVTFSVTDGINIASAASTFTLAFDTRVANSQDTIMLMKSSGNNVDNVSGVTAVTGQTVTKFAGNSSASVGSPELSSFSPYNLNTSIAWAGENSGENAQLIISTGDDTLHLSSVFTVECWVWLAKEAGGRYFIFGTGNSTQMSFGINGNYPEIQIAGGNTWYNNDYDTNFNYIPPHKWTHVMWCRDGTTYRMFLDGILVYSSTASGSTFSHSNSNTYVIGGRSTDGSASPFAMYDLRILKGTCRKTANFAPPTEPLERTGDGASTASHCVLQYMSPNENPGQIETQYTPTGGTTYRIAYRSPTGLAPTVQVHSPFRHRPWSGDIYGSSAYWDGQGDEFSIPTSSAYDLSANQAFTLEYWWHEIDKGYPTSSLIVDSRGDTANNGFHIGKQGTGQKQTFKMRTTAGNYNFAGQGPDLAPGKWNHYVWQYTGTHEQLFINGDCKYHTSNTLAALTHDGGTGNVWKFGKRTNDGGQNWIGHICDLRYVVGTAVYTASATGKTFTPPKGPLTLTGGTYSSTTNVNTSIPSGHTKILFNFNNPKVYDGVGAHTFHMNGTNSAGVAVASTGVKKYGPSSVSFPSNADKTMIDVHGSYGSFEWMWEFGCPFTIEGWVKTSLSTLDNSSKRVIFSTDIGYSNTTIDNLLIQIDNSAGALNVYSNGGINATSSTGIADGNWHHFAVTRTGSDVGSSMINIYIDGVHEVANAYWNYGLDYKRASYAGSVNPWTPRIGASSGSSGQFEGNLEDLRVSKRAIYPAVPIRETITTTSSYQTGITPTASNVSMLAFHTSDYTDDGGANANSGKLRFSISPESGRTPTQVAGPHGGMVGWRFDSTHPLDRLFIENSNGGYVDRAQDFTVEMWLKIHGNSSATQNILSDYDSTSPPFNIEYYIADTKIAYLYFRRGTGTNNTTYLTKATDGKVPRIFYKSWHHLAFTWDQSSDTGTIFVNGNYYDHSSTWENSLASDNSDFRIADSLPGSGPGNFDISNLRITKNQILYTRNFTPPSIALTG